MKTAMKLILLILFIGIMLITSQNLVEAVRFGRGGQDTYYNLTPCKDGMIVQLAYGTDSNQSTPVSARLTGRRVRGDNSFRFLDPITFPLVNGPVDIIDTAGVTQTLYYSIITSTVWSTSTLLLPGSRLDVDLYIPAVTVNNPFSLIVQDCSLGNPPPDRDTAIMKGPRFSFPANSNAPACGPGDVITSTIDLGSAGGPQPLPITDINFSMWLRTPSSSPSKLQVDDIRARLISPNATTVQLFDNVGGGRASLGPFGTRGARINGNLVGDPMADFVLDDSSLFEFSDGQTTYCNTPNLSIPDGTPAGVTDQIVIPAGGTLADLNVVISTTHTYVGDLVYTLEHVSTGTNVTIIDRPGVPATTFGCGMDDIDAIIDDEALLDVETRCNSTPPAISSRLIGGDPKNPNLLAAFDGEDMSGAWNLTVSDSVSPDTGTLVQWCLEPSTVAAGIDPTKLVVSPFNHEAVRPDENLSAFNGEMATGVWTLEICNRSDVATGEVMEWYLAVEAAPTCYALTRSYTGSGSQPTALPTNSTSCPSGQYIAGESINLTAFPATGHHVDSWVGTANDSSTANTNLVTMPAASHTVTANYVQDAPTCYALTRSYTGSGSQPTALPTNSTSCLSGQYIAGESINLTAFPATGHHVDSWVGTANDSSTANTNLVTMPAGSHTVTANYIEKPKYFVYLPIIVNPVP